VSLAARTYTAFVVDVFSQRILSWAIATTMTTQLVRHARGSCLIEELAEFGFGRLVLGQDRAQHRDPVIDQVES